MARHFFGIALLVHGALAAAPSPVTSGTPVQVWPCTAGSVRQTWAITRAGRPHDHIELGGVGTVPLQNLRLNTLGFSNVTGGIINVWVPADSSPWGEMWTYDASTLYIRNELNGLCAGTLNSTGSLPAGTAVVQVPCASVTAAQWTYVPATGAFTWGEDATLCLDAGATASCGAPPLAGSIFCNASYSIAARTEDLLSRLQPVEAVSMLAADNNGVPRLGVPPLRFGEALHGVLSGCGAAVPGSTGCPTSFPTGVALGSSFNNTLFSLVGRAIGTEARALFNQGVAGSAFFTPDINPFRDPRCKFSRKLPQMQGGGRAQARARACSSPPPPPIPRGPRHGGGWRRSSSLWPLCIELHRQLSGHGHGRRGVPFHCDAQARARVRPRRERGRP